MKMSRQEAIAAWNRRAPVSADAVPVKPRDVWQGIESAPTDGAEFLIAYSDGTVRVGRYLDNSHTAWPWKGVRPMYGAERAGNRITHWMPLPAPPEDDTARIRSQIGGA